MTPQEFFKGDIFALNAGVELLEVRKGYARAQLQITKEHLNAGGRTQGGVLFTLADLALAACSNSFGKLSFSLSADITFFRASGEGDTLTAIANMKYMGRSTGYFEVDITNQEDKLIASFRSCVFRMDQEVPFSVEP